MRRPLSAPASQSLSDLLAAYQAGDRQACREFHAALRPLIDRLVATSDVEVRSVGELVGRIVVQIHVARRSWRPGWPVEPWASAIVDHVIRERRTARPKAGLRFWRRAARWALAWRSLR